MDSNRFFPQFLKTDRIYILQDLIDADMQYISHTIS